MLYWSQAHAEDAWRTGCNQNTAPMATMKPDHDRHIAVAQLHMRRAEPRDRERLDEIRRLAFAPVFASFRALLGDAIYEQAQRPQDDAQAELLVSLLTEQSGWELWVAELMDSSAVAGFVALKVDSATGIGEIGINAVHPAHTNRGVGTALYEFGVSRMRAAGMKVAVVGTGGDASHAPARRAYRKAGFDHEIPGVWMRRLLEPSPACTDSSPTQVAHTPNDVRA